MNTDLHLAAKSLPARLGSSASCMDPYRKCNRSARRELQMHLDRMSWPTAFPLGTPWDGVLADACRGAVFRSPDVGAIRQLLAGLSAALVWLKSGGTEVRIDLWASREKSTTRTRCRIPGCAFHAHSPFSGNEKVGLRQAKISISSHMRERHGLRRMSEWGLEEPRAGMAHCWANFAQPKTKQEKKESQRGRTR
jgi:hypothetical protein